MNNNIISKLDGMNLSFQQKKQLIEVIKEVVGSNNTGGGSLTQTFVDVYYSDETYTPSYIIYDGKRVDILAENEGGFGTVYRTRDIDFYEWFNKIKPMYVNMHVLNGIFTTTAIVGCGVGSNIVNSTLSIIIPSQGSSAYEPSVQLHIEIMNE